MASGKIWGTFSNTSASNWRPCIEWSSTKNISANTSSVTASLVFLKYNGYWYPWNANGHTVSLSINGNSSSANRSFDLRSTSRQVIWTRTVTVSHNDDGKKSINIKASGNTGLSNTGSYNFNAKVKLDDIPRASSMSQNKTSMNFGDTVNFSISKAASSFTHTINYNINGHSGNVVTKTTGTSVNWTPALSLCSHIPTSTSTTATIWLDTYSGNTKVAATKYTIKLNVPSSVSPSVSSLTATEQNSTASGLSLGANNFIQGISTVRLAASASSMYGASINSYSINVGGFTTIASSSGTVNLTAFGTQSGNKTVTVTVKDSRGRTATRSLTISIQGYTPPRINSFVAKRSGTNAIITKNCTYTTLGGKNTITYSMSRSGGATGSISGIVHGTDSYTLSGYDSGKSYKFTLTITDKFSSTSSVTTIGTDKVPIHLNRDIGVGILKMNEGKAELEVGGNIMGRGLIVDEIVSTLIPAGANLNNYTKTGFYYCPTNADSATIANTPDNSAFSLLVEKHAGVKQTFTNYLNSYWGCSWTRNYYNGTWGKWRPMGDMYETASLSASSGFTAYSTDPNSSSYPKVIRSGDIVTLSGAFKNNASIAGSDQAHTMSVLPVWARPATSQTCIRQGSGGRRFLLFASPNGNLEYARNVDPTQPPAHFHPTPAGGWLTIDMTYNVRL